MHSVTLTITIGDKHGAVAVPTFPIALYVFFISYRALVLVPFTNLLDVFSSLHIVDSASACVLINGFGN
jgi:hypothetical protein